MFYSALFLFSFCLLIHYTYAYCPNGCNAKGVCGANDRCTCHTRADVTTDVAFIGADCSLMTCPKGAAWVDVAYNTDEAHQDVECSNRGICDRSSGACSCFSGYTGKACERTTCPNDCNGHGRCTTLSAITSTTYSAWDALKSMGCLCDVGFRGPDCSIKECPSGDDVLLGDGNTAGRECGSRGECDTTTGLCVCHSGYYGTYCNQQTTVA